MSKEQDNINQVAKVIDDGVDTFLEGVEKSQSGMFNKTLAIVKELETDLNGNIKQTVKNLKLLARVRKTIVDEILTESYQKRVKTFTNQYPAIQSLNNGYFKSIEAAFEPNRELYKQIVQKSIQTTSASLLESGIDQNVIEPIVRIVDDSVSTGATFTDMVDELRLVMKGDEERLGRLARYSSQITTDALNQFNGIYNETIGKDLDLEWYFYSGGIRKTSRPFCKKYAGRYFHKKEVEDFGRKKDLDGSNLCGGSSKTDLCQGRIPGTNSSSIFRYRAGYNCKHVYKPTTIAAVPKHVIDRNIKKGYYVPEGEEVITDQFVPAKTISDAKKTSQQLGFNAITDKNGVIEKIAEGQSKYLDQKTGKFIIDKRIFNEVKAELESDFKSGIIREMPTKESLKILNSVNKYSKITGDKIDVVLIDRLKSKNVAEFINQGKFIEYSNSKNLNKFISEDITKINDVTGYMPETFKDKIYGIQAHEYGHFHDLDNAKISQYLGKKFGKDYSANRWEWNDKNISLYASENNRELVAESYAISKHPNFEAFDIATKEYVNKLLNKDL